MLASASRVGAKRPGAQPLEVCTEFEVFMRLALALSVVLFSLIGAVTYAVSPLYTAWSIREAVKTDNTAYLRARISWPSVRQTLKVSLNEIALGPRVAHIRAGTAEAAKMGWWSRLKTAYGRAMVSRFVERYATPEGFKSLFAYGRTVRRNVLMKADPDAGLNMMQRLSASWSRVRRAEFVSLTRFELDLVDKYDDKRLYSGVLAFEIEDAAWTLQALHVRQLNDDEATPGLPDRARPRRAGFLLGG